MYSKSLSMRIQLLISSLQTIQTKKCMNPMLVIQTVPTEQVAARSV